MRVRGKGADALSERARPCLHAIEPALLVPPFSGMTLVASGAALPPRSRA